MQGDNTRKTNSDGFINGSKERSTFSGKIGFVLAAAGSAVGLGNIWRFPYLAAKYGGGMFLLVYIFLALTFGYTMIMAESSLGRMTGKGPIGAFRKAGAGKTLRFTGWLNAIIPALITPYYCVIGGWVLKFLWEYICGHEGRLTDVSADGGSYFGAFLGNGAQQMLFFVIFAFMTTLIVFFGVNNGIERVSRVAMPILIVLCLITVVYSVTRPGALEGVKYFLIPNFSNFSWMTVVAALGQLFYSLSIAMGIMITFGSYMKKEIDIEKSTVQVEIFDTSIAIMAGLMIIPAVFAFNGGSDIRETAGPSLMFVSLPHVFNSMGFGRGIGIVFFLLVLFAALTSAVSLAESVATTFEDEFGWERKKSACASGVLFLLLGTLSALGFSTLSGVTPLGFDFLDFFDFLTNSIMMPLAAIGTCILILKVITIEKIESEIESTSAFKRKKLFRVVLKYFAILFLIVILVSSILSTLASTFGIEALKMFII